MVDYLKKIKKEIKLKAGENPEKFFPVKTLKELGFKRYTCKKSGVNFWSTVPRDVCGEPEFMGGYTFIGNTPAKKSMEFCDIYLKFSEMLKKKGYTPIQRFPTVARWRDDLDFNIASIIGFQPYVVKGEVDPPANPLTIPQICLRFGDIDNTGYSGRHHTGFTMIGQHAFKDKNKYEQEKYFKDLMDWYLEGLKIPIDEITVHEDAWGGGGNCGASLEVFSGGLELGNQVYMMYDSVGATCFDELKELDIKVLDMGMGQERCCWFSKGSLNSYEACMPKVCSFLFEKTQIKPNWRLYEKFLPFSGILNVDEVEDIDEEWEKIANKLNVTIDDLKSTVEPLAALYSIADHTRTLLYAFCDGALPSNVKGGYNLRLLLRRSLEFIEMYKWDIDLFEIFELHARDLKPLYPELEKQLYAHTGDNKPTISKILDLEKEKYKQHKEKIKHKVQNLAKKGGQLSNEDFVKLYVSEGITPHDLKEGFSKEKISLSIPSNFFTLVHEFFEEKNISKDKSSIDELKEYVHDLPATQPLYYEDSFKDCEDVKILKEFSHKGKNYVVLEKTLFYPTGGGQLHDTGKIDGRSIVNVFKVEGVVLHEVK